MKEYLFKTQQWSFPGDPEVKNLPCNARDTGLIPIQGRSHMLQSNEACEPQLLSLCSGAWELQLLKPTCRNC